MSEELRPAMSAEYAKYNHWYYWDRCPLLPKYRYRPADRQNEWSVWASWLVFVFWAVSSPSIGFEFELNDQDIYAKIRFTYLIFIIKLPLFPYSFHQKTWRYPRCLFKETP